MKLLTITFTALVFLLAGCGSDGSRADTQSNATAYTPPQPAGVSADERPPSPPAIK